jgi:hypothetical protein
MAAAGEGDDGLGVGVTVCAPSGRDARTRTSCQFRPQLRPQRQAVPRGYVNRTNQHRHPTPRSDHAGEFGKPAVGVHLVQFPVGFRLPLRRRDEALRGTITAGPGDRPPSQPSDLR